MTRGILETPNTTEFFFIIMSIFIRTFTDILSHGQSYILQYLHTTLFKIFSE